MLCALMAFSLAFVPVAHASVLMFDGSHAPDTETVHDCDQSPSGFVEVSIDSHHQHSGGVSGTDSEHDVNCQLACNILVLHPGGFETGDNGISNHWISPGSSGLYSSFSARLERPPRS